MNLLITLLPFAFALHNFEETLRMEHWTKSTPSFIHKPVTARQFGIAVSLFTGLGFTVVFAKGLYKTEELYYLFVSGFAGILFLNTFIPHLIATIYMKKYAPGVITALLINLPLSTLVLLKIKESGILTLHQILASVVIAGVIGVILTYIFLKIGSVLSPAHRDG